MTIRLHRRKFLMGASGAISASVALPMLEAMMPRRALASGAFPNRFLVAFGGVTTAAARHMAEVFSPLDSLAAERTLITGLQIDTANSDALVPPGGRFNQNHGKELSPMFSGVRSLEGDHATFRGATADQLVNDAVGGALALPTGLQLLVQPVGYLYGGAGRNALSARGAGTGARPVSAIHDPAFAFDHLFGSVGPAPMPGPTPTPSGPSELLLQNRSVNDLILHATERLTLRLGYEDRQRLECHLEEIRAVERRIQQLIANASGMTPGPGPGPAPSSCTSPTRPATVAATSTFTASNGDLVGWSQEDVRADIMAELAALAFACDLTRSITWQISWDQCGISSRDIPGVGDNRSMHEIGHAGTDPQKVAIARWHVEQFAKVVNAIRRRDEGGASMLESTFCALFFAESPASHGSTQLTVPVVGRPDVLRMGTTIAATGEHPAKVLIAGMQATGVDTDVLGEVSGALSALQR